MYNYKEYKKMKKGTPTCGECKFFIESENGGNSDEEYKL